jgi:nitroreductase
MNVRLEEISPLGAYSEGMPWNPVEKVIYERRSTRKFKKEPLPDSMIRRILEAGRFAPSSGNSMPWKFIVINSPKIIAEMERDAIKMSKLFMFFLDYTKHTGIRRLIKMPMAALFTRLLHNELHPAPFWQMTQMSKEKTDVFHKAPTLVLLLTDVRGVANPYVEHGICGQNMVLAAHSMGAASCWIGLIKLLTYMPKWRKKFGIKFPYRLEDGIVLGWPSPRADGYVPRETSRVAWYEGEMNDEPRIEIQGE